MFKTFNKALSLFMVIAFILSLVPVATFAAEPYDFPGINPGTTILKADSGSPKGYQRMESVTGYIGGKGDAYLLLADSAGSKRREVIKADDAPGPRDVFEISLYFPSNANNVSLPLYLTNISSNSVSVPLYLKDDGLYVVYSTTQAKICTLERDKWHTLAFITPEPYNASDATHDTYVTIYVNGEYKTKRNVSSTKSGLRNRVYVTAAGDGTSIPQLYMDNIRAHSGEYIADYDKVDNIGYVDGVEDDEIFVRSNTTVAQLKEGITKKDDTIIRVYKTLTSTEVLADDEIVKEGYVVVAAAKNGTTMERSYNYYNVRRYIHQYPNINDGTTVLPLAKNTNTSAQKMEVVNGNLGGKGDEYLMWCDSAGTTQRTISISNASGKRDVLEFSFYIPSESQGFSIGQFLSNTANTGAGGYALWFKPDALYRKWSGNPGKICNLEPDKWHTFAMITPEPYSDGSEPEVTTIKYYIDGKLIKDSTNSTKTGFRYLNLYCFGNGAVTPAVYFDNIRVHSNTYEPQYDVLDSIGYVDGVEGDKIIVKDSVTVAQLKEGITKKDDTTIRVYRSLTSTEVLGDNERVNNGYVVVAAAKNDAAMERTYNYYTVEKYDYETSMDTLANGEAATSFDANDALAATASFANYTHDKTYNLVFYAAQYVAGELVGIWEDSKTVTSGGRQKFEINLSDIQNKENSKIKIMLIDAESSNPYAVSKSMAYSN